MSHSPDQHEPHFQRRPVRSMKALNDLIVEAAQKLRALDAERYADVIRWMLAREKRERDAAKPRRKHKQVLFTERGERIELYKETIKRLEEE